ncbi:hypothetical protein Tco_1449078 [Tanacetum coccineum]
MLTQQDIYAVGSENHPPMLNKDNYVPWSSRDLDHEVPIAATFHEHIDDELTEKEVKKMEANDQAIQTILIGSDIGLQEKKAKLFNEWENFASTDGELIESYYHHFSKLMNDFKRNKHFPEKIASNLKFFNNLQPEWKRHVTIVHQIKDLNTIDYTQLYDFLKYNQVEMNELRAERLTKSHDPLALMANSNNPYNFLVFHQDQPSPITYMQQPQPNNNLILQPSFNIDFMQQLMPNPKDITDPTTAMNMALMVGGNGGNQFRQYVGQNVGNQVVQNAVQNLGVQNVRNQNGIIVVPGHLARNCIVRPRRRDAVYLWTQLFIAQKEEAGIQLQAEEFDLMAIIGDLDEIEEPNANCILMANLQQASTSGTQTNKALVYDPDGSSEVIQICLWCIDLGCSKHMTKNLKLLINFVWKFMGTVRFGNDHGLGHNLFSVRQFCDSELEVAFRRKACFVRNLEGVDLLKGNHTTNLYTIILHEMASASPICLMAHATSTKYHKEHLCPSYEQGKSKKASHPPKPIPNSKSKDKAPEEIKTFLKKITILLQALVIINDREDIGKLGAKEAAKFVRDFKSLANEADESLDKQKTLELEIDRLLRAIDQIMMNVYSATTSCL